MTTSDHSGATRSFAFVLGALVVVVLTLSSTYLPAGPMRARRDTARLVWPMAWGFFTDASRDFLVAYRVDGRVPLPALAVTRHGGLSRSGHGDLVRLVHTARGIPADAWRSCDTDDVWRCAPGPPVTVASRFPDACGPHLFAVERPSTGPTRHVVRIAAVTLAC